MLEIGVAMQFAYQFPDRLGRLVLVNSGGLGSEVVLCLRAVTLPGASTSSPPSAHLLASGRGIGSVLGKLGRKASPNMNGLAEGMESLGEAEKRRASVHTARSVIDPKGQRVDASDRLYLSKDVSALLIWAEDDP